MGSEVVQEKSMLQGHSLNSSEKLTFTVARSFSVLTFPSVPGCMHPKCDSMCRLVRWRGVGDYPTTQPSSLEFVHNMLPLITATGLHPSFLGHVMVCRSVAFQSCTQVGQVEFISISASCPHVDSMFMLKISTVCTVTDRDTICAW